ncbi:hypothetical protein BDW74DRAFT_172870 [Aspergillus multicolor]|uniref:uncharacterized protein n=1 Tax=Aspergillus multicolor TaxID=41759 RepID=UPI003CCD06D0
MSPEEEAMETMAWTDKLVEVLPDRPPSRISPFTATNDKNTSDADPVLDMYIDEEMLAPCEGTVDANKKGCEHESRPSNLQPIPIADLNLAPGPTSHLPAAILSGLPTVTQQDTAQPRVGTPGLPGLDGHPGSASTGNIDGIAVSNKDIQCAIDNNNAVNELLEGCRKRLNNHGSRMANALNMKAEENVTLRKRMQELDDDLQATHALAAAAEGRVQVLEERNTVLDTAQDFVHDWEALRSVEQKEKAQGCGEMLDECGVVGTKGEKTRDERQVTHPAQPKEAPLANYVSGRQNLRIEQLEMSLRTEQAKVKVMKHDAEEMINYVLRLQRTLAEQRTEIKSLNKSKEDLAVAVGTLQQRLSAETEKLEATTREKEELHISYESLCEVQDNFFAGLKDMADRLQY